MSGVDLSGGRESPGWRRLWPSRLWLRTVVIQAEPPMWNWEIWSADRKIKLACGAEEYTRQASAARGGVRFGSEEMKNLETMGQRG